MATFEFKMSEATPRQKAFLALMLVRTAILSGNTEQRSHAKDHLRAAVEYTGYNSNVRESVNYWRAVLREWPETPFEGTIRQR